MGEEKKSICAERRTGGGEGREGGERRSEGSGYRSGSSFRRSLCSLFHLHLGLHFAEIIVEVVKVFRQGAVHVGSMIAHEIFLREFFIISIISLIRYILGFLVV